MKHKPQFGDGHSENRPNFGKSVTEPKCSKCARGVPQRSPDRKNVIFLRKNIFGAPKLISEYFIMILNRFSNRLRGGNRGNARERLKISKKMDFPHFASRGGFGADLGRILEISKTKTKISRSRIFAQKLIFYF